MIDADHFRSANRVQRFRRDHGRKQSLGAMHRLIFQRSEAIPRAATGTDDEFVAPRTCRTQEVSSEAARTFEFKFHRYPRAAVAACGAANETSAKKDAECQRMYEDEYVQHCSCECDRMSSVVCFCSRNTQEGPTTWGTLPGLPHRAPRGLVRKTGVAVPGFITSTSTAMRAPSRRRDAPGEPAHLNVAPHTLTDRVIARNHHKTVQLLDSAGTDR